MVSYNQPLRKPVNQVDEAFDKSASDIMEKKFLTLTSDMKITKAAKLISKHDVSGAPVVNSEGRLLGVISQKDCLKFLLDLKYYNSEEASVEKYMSQTVMTIDLNERLLYMTELFIKNNFQLYPVVDGDGYLQGVVTRSNLFKEINKISQTNW